jgi:hypothetical protein
LSMPRIIWRFHLPQHSTPEQMQCFVPIVTSREVRYPGGVVLAQTTGIFRGVVSSIRLRSSIWQ